MTDGATDPVIVVVPSVASWAGAPRTRSCAFSPRIAFACCNTPRSTSATSSWDGVVGGNECDITPNSLKTPMGTVMPRGTVFSERNGWKEGVFATSLLLRGGLLICTSRTKTLRRVKNKVPYTTQTAPLVYKIEGHSRILGSTNETVNSE